ncbi:MAG: TolB family protein [Actinomycetota bacterium]
MADMERDLRNMMGRTADGVRHVPRPSRRLVRRAHLRRARTTLFAGAVGVGLVLGGFAVRSAVSTDAAPARPANPQPAPAARGALAYALDGDIYVADQDGSNAVKIADGRSAEECHGLGEYWAEGSMWSPDGRYLAYRRYTDCSGSENPLPRDVVISDAEGNVFATFPAQGWDIAWSPDSTRVAVWDQYFETTFTIGIYGLDGARQTQLTMPPGWEPSGDYDPVWAQDSTSLIVADTEVPLDGGAPQQLRWGGEPISAFMATSAAYSPDGSQVAYSGHRSLVVARSDGSGAQKVFGDWAGDPSWSPTGERIAFATHAGTPDFSELRVVDMATGSVTLLTEAERGQSLGNWGFSPQGDRILYSIIEDRGEGESSLWSISIDGSDARLLVAGTNQGEWRSR